MHRYKLSPRGKLYLKTDAEGKRKTEFDVEKTRASVLQIAQAFFAMIFSFAFHSQSPPFFCVLVVEIIYQFFITSPFFSHSFTIRWVPQTVDGMRTTSIIKFAFFASLLFLLHEKKSLFLQNLFFCFQTSQSRSAQQLSSFNLIRRCWMENHSNRNMTTL